MAGSMSGDLIDGFDKGKIRIFVCGRVDLRRGREF